MHIAYVYLKLVVPLIIAFALKKFGGFVRKWVVVGRQCTTRYPLTGKVAIVTGATTGIGLATAKELALYGATVIGTTRTKEAYECLAHPGVSFVPLDLGSMESVARFVSTFNKNVCRCDILINNGGVMVGPLKATTDGYEEKFGINHLGHFALTMGLLKKLQSCKGRIITVSSLGHEYAPRGAIDFGTLRYDDWKNHETRYDSLAAYCQSKMANILFAKELGRRVPDVLSVSVHPGRVLSATVDREYFSSHLGKLIRPIAALFLKTPFEGAQTILHCVFSETLLQGAYYANCRVAPVRCDAEDKDIASRLWCYSCDAISSAVTY